MRLACSIAIIVVSLGSGCVYKTYNPQYVSAVQLKEVPLSEVKATMERAAKLLDFSEPSEASVAEFLAETNRFEVHYRSTHSNAFIAASNLNDVRCVAIGVYSPEGAARATEIGVRFESSLAPIREQSFRPSACE